MKLRIVVLLVVATCIAVPGESAAAPAAKRANVYVVASKSFCAATGIYDQYSGDGRVEFFITLHNSGGKAGTLTLTPVRYYDDGQMNESVMDILTSGTVPPRATRKFHSDPFSYKAHQHEVAACSLKVNGHEIKIRTIHLG
jgi:hypothetical protein